MEHLSSPGISGCEYRAVIFVLRKTYGFKKKKDVIPLSQFQKATGMSRRLVVTTLKSLVLKRVLEKEKNSYSFNKNWETWVVSKRAPSVQLGTKVVLNRVPKLVSNRAHSKERKKLSKEIAAKAAEPFSLQEAIRKMEESPQRHMNIIALYFREKRPDLRTREQGHVAVTRHLRAAKSLSNFNNNQILDAIPKAKRLTEEWTLETIIKVLTK